MESPDNSPRNETEMESHLDMVSVPRYQRNDIDSLPVLQVN